MGDTDARVRELVESMGGEGEFVNPESARALWQAYSTDFCASWLVVDAGTLGNFAAWLINRPGAVVRHASPEVSRAIAREMYLTGELVALVRYTAQFVDDEEEREDILLRLADIMTPPTPAPEVSRGTD